jgi:amino acid adenylation domain-containing protein
MRVVDVRTGSLVQAFAQQAENHPDAVALVSGLRELSYGELHATATRFARVLQSRGAKPGDLVAVSLDRSVEAFVVLLGILKAGCAYVPLDPTLPPLRRTAIATDAQARLLVVTHREFVLRGFEGHSILYPEIEAELAGESRGDLGPPDGPDVCCVLYTSGTTGTPKGVVVPGSAILNHASWMWRAYPFRDGDLALIHRSCVYMAATWDYFGPLLGGAPALIVPGHQASDPAVLTQLCVEHGVSHVSGSPGFWRTVLDRPKAQLDAWHALRLGTTSGEALPVGIVRDWRRAFPHATLLNVYGITEAVRPAVCDTRAVADDDTRVPIGTPLPNVELRIVDEHAEPVEPGRVGEICVVGPCVALGYLNQPVLTAERFVTDPSDGGRMAFRTGDLGRVRSDGRYEVTGRVDHQVKIRAFRVELEEIEAALHAWPPVRRAVVVAHEDPQGDRKLIAYIVPTEDTVPTWREFRAFLDVRLPDYMIPASFVLVDALPLTASGKVDRQALSALSAPAPAEAGQAAPPIGTVTEAALARIWSDVMGEPAITPGASFLELGGHSLMAMHIASRVHLAFGVELPLESFFPNPTLRAMASAIDGLREAAERPLDVR